MQRITEHLESYLMIIKNAIIKKLGVDVHDPECEIITVIVALLTLPDKAEWRPIPQAMLRKSRERIEITILTTMLY